MARIAYAGFQRAWRDNILRLPVRVLVLGYLSYIVIGWALLALPLSQKTNVDLLDNFFIATSAVSTTGLITVDPGSVYTFFGQLVVLVLIQIGGLGYMTAGSIALLVIGHNLTATRQTIGRAAFGLPADIDIARFIRHIMVYAFGVEAIAAWLLWPQFKLAGIEDALWSAVFHSVSAFCTAGFSLNADSFVRFADNGYVLTIISVTSILGAVGYFVVADVWRRLFVDGKPLSLTSVLVLPVTAAALGLGTLVFLNFEPVIAAMPEDQHLANAFFQAMTAATTVGFNSIDTTRYAAAAIVFSYILMLVGASPAGTGGGLKTTTVGIMATACAAALRGRAEVVMRGRRIPTVRVVQALALAVLWAAILAIATFILSLTEKQAFDVLLFEAISAMATVGLSLGATAKLSVAGKCVIITLMFIGRVGVIAFFIALARNSDAAPGPAREQEVLI